MRATGAWSHAWATLLYQDWLAYPAARSVHAASGLKRTTHIQRILIVRLALISMLTARLNYNRYTSTILLQSLLSNPRSLGAFRSAVYSFIDTSLINSSSHGVCVSSTSRTWSSKRSSIFPRCLSKRRMDAMFLCLTRCKRDCRKPMMNKGKSSGLMRLYSLSQLM